MNPCYSKKTRSRFLGSTACFAIAVSLIGISGPVTAQTQDQATENTEVDQIIITGSRLRRSSETSTVPISVTPAVEFENRGFVNIIDALNEDVNFVGNTTSAGNQVQNGDSFAFSNILGLGTQRTIVLVDGRRFVPTNQNTVFVPGNNTGAQVDVSIIPPALIERLETVIASGGAVYGADAVGGAINVILKDNFEGISGTAQFGITERGDGETYRFSATYGRNFANDRGNVVASVDYLN